MSQNAPSLNRLRVALWPRRSRGALGNIAFWSLITAVVLFLLKLIPSVRPHIALSPWFALAIWVLASLPRFFRWMRWKLLWKLRNRLFVTYLLIGVTPIVLFGILAGIASYVLFGQFANFAATSEINTELVELASNTQTLAMNFQSELTASIAHAGRNHAAVLPAAIPPGAAKIVNTPALQVSVYLDGKLQPLDLPPGRALNLGTMPPSWMPDSFRGLVVSGNHVYFCAMRRVQVGDRNLLVLTGQHLDPQFLSRIVSGLGRMTLMPTNMRGRNKIPHKAYSSQQSASAPNTSGSAEDSAAQDYNFEPLFNGSGQAVGEVSGGTLPKAANIFDLAINFPTTLDARSFESGQKTHLIAIATSRPSLVYQRLFQQSVGFGVGVRVALILTAVVFAILELLAIFLASRLSRTITRSVSDLYHATGEVDQGRLNYRIPVSRRDQLAALSRSFNTMSESLSRLMDEQKEKERLQGELAIAQEVQSNLFPACDVRLGELELHGVCRPARTVSGDYYDFLVLDDDALFLALGDISGKGISAALLMAGLHSAVRAYRFAGEEAFAAAPVGAFSSGNRQELPPDMFRSPGNLMRMLNQHLYRSTQPEKYATLFLAHYEARDCTLRYSNGGQLPPLILRGDGSILRLDRGGTAVGLLDNMEYEEGVVVMGPGDMLIAYSDGVTEPENEFGDFGEARMVDIVRRNRHLPLEEITDRVMQALQDWIGADEQPDDITIVLARQN